MFFFFFRKLKFTSVLELILIKSPSCVLFKPDATKKQKIHLEIFQHSNQKSVFIILNLKQVISYVFPLMINLMINN